MVESFVSWGPWGLAAAAFLAGSLVPLPSEVLLVAGAFRVPWRAALPLLTLGKAARYAVVAAGALALRAGAP